MTHLYSNSLLSMPQSYKTRWKIMEEEVFQKKNSRLYIEKNVKAILEKIYPSGEINLNSSYRYKRIKKLIKEGKVIECWTMWKYIQKVWYIISNMDTLL